MEKIALEVKPRDLGDSEKKLSLNQLRKEGWIPGVVYGHGKPATISVNSKSFNKAIHNKAGLNALFNVTLDGKITLSIIKDLQRDMFSQAPIHVDFQRINVKEKITVKVPVHTKGESTGVKNDGGILEHIERELEVRCLPDDIPPFVEVDVTNLKIHDGIHVSDLKLSGKVEVLTPGDHLVVNVVAPKVEEIPEPTAAPAEGAEAAAGAEPEVIAKGKEKEGKEGEEAAGKGAAPAAKKEDAKK